MNCTDFPVWITRIVGMMQTTSLCISLFATEEQPNEPAPLANVASNDGKKNHRVLNNAFEKEVDADIKGKRNNVWCQLALTVESTTLMLMRHGCVGDDGIEDDAKALSFFARKISESGDADSVLCGGTACLTTARGFWGFFQLLHQRTRVAQKTIRSKGRSLSELLQRLVSQWSANGAWNFAIQENVNPGNELYKDFWKIFSST